MAPIATPPAISPPPSSGGGSSSVIFLAQAVALLCCIAYHGAALVTTLPWVLARSLALTLQQRLRRSCGPAAAPAAAAGGGQAAVFYEGFVTHVRRRPKANAFRYRVRTAVISLDDPPAWFSATEATDHLSADTARAFAGTDGPVKLLTNPETAGYLQNPISVYYCYDGAGGELSKCIAEVTNTPWGERVQFVFTPAGEQVKKCLHVSPFMDMESTWHISATDPRDTLKLVVRVTHPSMGDFFLADLLAVRATRPSAGNEDGDIWQLIRYGFQPHRIAVLIYYQALVLLYKGVPLYSPPNPKEYQASILACPHVHPRNGDGQHFAWQPARSWPWNAYY